ncbi:hypothetical protein ACTBT5_004288, partial [Yersinia enterocolitica]
MTAGTQTGDLTLTPSIGGMTLPAQSIELTPVVVPTNSSITAADTHLSADGTATTTLTLTL